ncbi:MOSC N-terminal beta barrel domain-containing protein [Kitasatospora sp. MAP5-34]|uniref:MOSC domain-containing protein n=1 Tax=Kitasatospora sp. MAP5-34 TaxID=3035102 RepID=UPI00247396E6|nr:MOSC N-terminal beta barrel domain-containing protein [Kitasatospora sp. MAP5-34]MDH6578445.1 uncharacterized protein YcbX [Kitasatospora sp. MAP5-34]
MILGKIQALRRHPVKSLLGEEIVSSEVTERGLTGDRTAALLDLDTGRIASAKNPYRWRQLLTLSAAFTERGIRITQPTGKLLWSDEPGVDGVLSELLGRRVSLIHTRPPGATLLRSVPEEVLRHGVEVEVPHAVVEFGKAAPAGTFFDYAPLHLLTTATLDGMAVHSPRGVLGAARYRPNLVIRSDGPPFAENDWVDRELSVGPDLRIQVLIPTPRCAMPTLAHGVFPPDTHAFSLPDRFNRIEPLPGIGPLACAGAYAKVLRPGRISLGDVVKLL